MSAYLIGIAGPSGAGKTELARALGAKLSAPVIPLDAYYRDMAGLPMEVRVACNFDAPDSLDFDLLARHLALLAAGRDVEIPAYDFARYTRAAEVERVQPGEFVIVEGLFTLYWDEVRRLLSTRVYVELDNRTCFERRLARDVRERGRTPESVRMQYVSTVRPMAERYVLPARDRADVVVHGAAPLELSVAAVLAHASHAGMLRL